MFCAVETLTTGFYQHCHTYVSRGIVVCTVCSRSRCRDNVTIIGLHISSWSALLYFSLRLLKFLNTIHCRKCTFLVKPNVSHTSYSPLEFLVWKSYISEYFFYKVITDHYYRVYTYSSSFWCEILSVLTSGVPFNHNKYKGVSNYYEDYVTYVMLLESNHKYWHLINTL